MLIRRLAVVGTGLIGTSVALAARGAGVDVVLHDVDPQVARRAADLGAGRLAGTGWGQPAHPDDVADLVLVACPPGLTAQVLLEAQQQGLGTTYTDVASVKAQPLARIEAAGGADSYVGGHPMAGRERSGPGAARGDLFLGRPWVLTPGAAGPGHLERVQSLVQLCGALPVVLPAAAHDEAVALVSHAPQVLSSLVAARLRDAAPAAVELAGQGVRDVTRIAASDPDLWTGILAANAGPVRDVLVALRADLDLFVAALDALASDNGTGAADEVRGLLADGVAGRARIPGKHGAPAVAYAAVPVVIGDRPGELARLLVAAGEAGVNVEDVSIEHSPGQPVGLVELAVKPAAADDLAAALRAAGWTVHR